MARSNHGPHRLQHTEGRTTQCQIGLFSKGDVVVRQGAPCMVVSVVDRHIDVPTELDKVWVCSLSTGSVWSVPRDELVWPATEVQLHFETSRVGE